ncbi:uncharacterized protein Z520_07460 [Fonsecaea multimorphosa CBS 102226]|uniref:Uncharacterized protein n=1 Tax=Fonsecaea multimorphosa CBS 102226 TaxID=1442371 RepID=A0A0D2II75_9EURO|nr:uncharacterized protein Z520_07460 [Fonsecaea multimorphosa CBS 102226]KIX96741.1 hypothetical protein Z520_07460 [Fonsecaea multimorphosa CBS 102226]OAL22422.1 hypothetical protein AYO22_06979 [Fonsecaea multimorphosa]
METTEPIMALPPIDTSVGVPLLARDSMATFPEISQITLENPRTEWHTYSEACPSPNVPTRCESISRTRMPQFRQSRRWARMYARSRAEMDAAPTRPSTGDRCSSATGNDQQNIGRSMSLQQHRLLPKAVGNSFGRPKIPRNISEASTNSGGLCAHSAAYYWRCVKPLISKVPRAGSRVWPNRRPRNRKVTTTRRQDAAGRRPSALIFVPPVLRGESNPEKDNHNICCESGFTITNGGLRSCLNGNCRAGNEPEACSALAPSSILNNPINSDGFSDECRNVLKNLNFDSDRLVPTTSAVPAVVTRSSARKYTSRELIPMPEDTARKQLLSQAITSKPLPPSPEVRAPHNTPTAPLSAHPPQRREFVAQAPGNTLSSLNRMLQTKQAEPLAVSSSLNSLLEHQNTTTRPQPRQAKHVMRLSSARSAKSAANTLAGIEAQVQRMSHYSIDVEVRRNGSTDSGARNSGPPPNIPLPALPPEAHDLQLAVTKSSEDLAKLEGGLEENLQICVHFVRHVIRSTRADKVKEKRMRDLAKSRVRLSKVDSLGTNETRHKALMSKASPAIAYHVDELDRFPAVPDSRPTSLCSRSTSCYSRQHSPELRTRQQQRCMSKVQSTEIQRSKPPPQTLSQSNIFVVVDSDPVTARFRAGAISPRLSIAGSVTGVASARHARTPSKLKEVMANRLSLRESPRRDTILGSPMESPRRKAAGTSSPLGEQAVKPRRSRSCSSGQTNKLPGRIGSPAPSTAPSSSSDDHWLTPGEKISPIKPASQQRNKRRRWNSGDINLVRQLHRDLHDYYVTILEQEEKIKWQATQIQTMMKIFAPMRHIPGGLEEPVLLHDSPDRDTPTPTNSRTLRKCRSALAGDRRPPSSGSRSRFPLDSINERTLNSQGHNAVNEDDATSTAPSSETSSLVSIKASASDTSLTEQEKVTVPVGKQGADVETWGWI